MENVWDSYCGEWKREREEERDVTREWDKVGRLGTMNWERPQSAHIHPVFIPSTRCVYVDPPMRSSPPTAWLQKRVSFWREITLNKNFSNQGRTIISLHCVQAVTQGGILWHVVALPSMNHRSQHWPLNITFPSISHNELMIKLNVLINYRVSDCLPICC